jgi:WD40 repeat protein
VLAVPTLAEVGKLPEGASALAASPDGRYLAAWVWQLHMFQLARNAIDVWELPSLRHVTALDLPGEFPQVRQLLFSPDGRWLAAHTVHLKSSGTIVAQGTAIVWDIPDGQLQSSRRATRLLGWKNRQDLLVLDYSKLTTFTVASGVGVERPSPFHWFSHRADGPPTLSGGGRFIVHADDWRPAPDRWVYWLRERGVNVPWSLTPPQPAVFLFDADTGQTVAELVGVRDPLPSPDGRTLAVTRGGTVELWDMPPRRPWAYFLGGAGLLAVLIAWLARWRVRIGEASCVAGIRNLPGGAPNRIMSAD